MKNKRSRRLRSSLEGVTEAAVAEIEAYLRASGWKRRRTKGSHRAWIKEGHRTLVIPVHGTRVRQHIIRQVLEATDEEAGDASGD